MTNERNRLLDLFPHHQRHTIRSPLRYPGGKSREVARILKFIPRRIDELCAPFFGGGSVELSCAASGITVHGSDGFLPLAIFWRVLLADPAGLADHIRSYHPMTARMFSHLRRTGTHMMGDELDLAARFFALNRTSFSGTTLAGGMSPTWEDRFNERSIDRLREFHAPNLEVKYCGLRRRFTGTS